MESPTIIPPRAVRANVSRLEPFRAAIATARKQRLSYRAIVTILGEQHQVPISHRGLADFCLRRGIVKGIGETEASVTSVTVHVSPNDGQVVPTQEPEADLPLDGGFKLGRNKKVETWKSTTGVRPSTAETNAH